MSTVLFQKEQISELKMAEKKPFKERGFIANYKILKLARAHILPLPRFTCFMGLCRKVLKPKLRKFLSGPPG